MYWWCTLIRCVPRSATGHRKHTFWIFSWKLFLQMIKNKYIYRLPWRRKKKSIVWCEIFSQWRIGVHGGSGYTTSMGKNLVVFAGYESVARRFLCKEIFNVHSPGYSPFTWDRRCNIPSEGHHSWTVTFPQKGLRRTDKDTRDDRETNPEHSDKSQAF